MSHDNWFLTEKTEEKKRSISSSLAIIQRMKTNIERDEMKWNGHDPKYRGLFSHINIQQFNYGPIDIIHFDLIVPFITSWITMKIPLEQKKKRKVPKKIKIPEST